LDCPNPEVLRKNRLALVLALAALVLAVGRIVATYGVFSQTWDEPAHVAAGMEWLDRGTYTYEELHPPLARVAVALGPYLAGIRLSGQFPRPEDMWAEGNEIFHAQGEYSRHLALARLGVIPFFVLATIMVWVWARSLFGDRVALGAVVLFTTSPPVLGHGGIATTDVPFTAAFTLALFVFARWLEEPTPRRSLWLGVTAALAVVTKFSALVFLPSCMVVLWILRLAADRTSLLPLRPNAWRLTRSLGLALAAAVVLVWGMYRFSFHAITGPQQRPHATINHFLGPSGKLHDVTYSIAENTPVPAPAFFQGINRVRDTVTSGRQSYLLGEVRSTGWWYFFPVALGVKTPIAYLILVACGISALATLWKARRDWRILAPAVAAATILLVCLPVKFNIGLRHILPIYPLLSVLAGLGFVGLWQATRLRLIARISAVGLLTWQLIATGAAHPDYLAYFNESARGHPERILVDSDLDCGQDLLRLVDAVHSLRVKELAISYNGSADLTRHGLPQFHALVPHQPSTGWVAISMYRLKIGGGSLSPDAYSWLNAYSPVRRIGKSILLYYIHDPVRQELLPGSH
jgi:4-amino-4-deoxy-L-arabinose transferase-like glycosyltransferase